MQNKKIGALGWLMAFVVSLSFAQPEPSSTIISVITCAPGKDIYTVYGHTAIRLRDTMQNEDLVFNYGTFDFQTEGFIYKFLKGRLPYYLAVGHFDGFMEEYRQEGRSVTEQVILLDDVQKQQLIKALWVNAAPENREYMYDFFFDNCSTRVRDIIGQVGNTTWGADQASGKSFRTLIKEFQTHTLWTDFGIDLIIGARADAMATRKDACFLPDYLMREIDSQSPTIVQSKNLLLPMIPHYDGNHFLQFFLSPFNIFFILLLLELYLFGDAKNDKGLAKRRRYDLFWAAILIICIGIMTFMWFGTDHKATKDNWNILWALVPLPILLFRKLPKWVYYITIGALTFILFDLMFGLFIIPQKFNIAIIIILMILIVKVLRIMRVERISP